MPESTRRTVWIDDDLWSRAIAAAAQVAQRELRTVPLAELVRRGLVREVERIEREMDGQGR